MKLTKYSFTCPVCDQDFYTYISQNQYKEILDNKPMYDIFANYPDDYKKMLVTSICMHCLNTSRTICLPLSDEKDDDKLYRNIEEIEQNV